MTDYAYWKKRYEELGDLAVTRKGYGRDSSDNQIRTIVQMISKYLFALKVRSINVLTPESKILDFGCGIGRLIPFLDGEGEYHGVDIIDQSNHPNFKNNPAAKFHLINTEATDKLPFKTDTFDSVFVLQVFQHLDDWDQLGWWCECTRVLKKPGGIIAILDSLERGSHLWKHDYLSEINWEWVFKRECSIDLDTNDHQLIIGSLK